MTIYLKQAVEAYERARRTKRAYDTNEAWLHSIWPDDTDYDKACQRAKRNLDLQARLLEHAEEEHAAMEARQRISNDISKPLGKSMTNRRTP